MASGSGSSVSADLVIFETAYHSRSETGPQLVATLSHDKAKGRPTQVYVEILHFELHSLKCWSCPITAYNHP